ncbi:MAG: arsenical pump-driving ATPase [Acidocella sp.]|nr:arsenical pump-driving ATPase [Acidocella sp.]
MELLAHVTPYLFFTGKGGVGKTTIACAVAISLAAQGKRVLLVSTDPASNLGEMLETAVTNVVKPVSGVPRLDAVNIDPEAAAEEYRRRVLAPYIGHAPEHEIQRIREELSGACTVEIAAFDEFAGLLAGDRLAAGYDHIVFDTAPTGHTLRLLSLPRAWSGFLEHDDRGASCLGPHSGLKMQRDRFAAAWASLSDPERTTIVLVARPEPSALSEAAHTAGEFQKLELTNQRLVINGLFHASSRDDRIAIALEQRGQAALATMPAELACLPRDTVPLKPVNMVGLAALRSVLASAATASEPAENPASGSLRDVHGLEMLVDELSARDTGLVMVMGKGGVGKTTIAAAIAVALADRGHMVHLSTTDPAAHLAYTLAGQVPNLSVSRIDPKAETEAYIAKIMASRGKTLDEAGRALLAEDLRSPCTEEVAVFHAFARLVAQARTNFIVLDTAPTGHTLLLLDETGSYHRQVLRDYDQEGQGRLVTPLMRLRDPDYCRMLLVTLAETTPISEAASLQDDLRRASIEPFAWVINASLAATETHDPLLMARISAEIGQIKRVRKGLAKRLALVAWQAKPPVGAEALRWLTRSH